MLLIAQITDTHLFSDSQNKMFDCPTNQTFAAVINTIANLQPPPDILLLTGDISQDETVASYQYAKSLIEPLKIPTYWLPGNHDQNIQSIRSLNGDYISAIKSFARSGWQFILLDSMVIQQPYGELSIAQLEFLTQQLENDLPTLVAVHHPAIACGLGYMDEIGLRNAADFWEVIDRHPQVKVILSGHIHQEFATQRHHVKVLGTPSTCIQLKPNQPQVEIDDRPPGFRLLQLYQDGQVETEIIWIHDAKF
jgi:3',5'-cyclic-AMP phosphodiesterase